MIERIKTLLFSSIRRKIFAGFSLFIIVVFLYSSAILVQLSEMKVSSEFVSPASIELSNIQLVSKAIYSFESSFDVYLLLKSSQSKNDIDTAVANINRAVQTLSKSDLMNKVYSDKITLLKNKTAVLEKLVVGYMSTSGVEKFSARMNNESISDIYSNVKSIKEVTYSIDDSISDRLRSEGESQRHIIRNILLQTFVFALITIVLVVIVVGVMTRNLSHPLINLANVAMEISRGKMEERAPVLSNDEVGRLAESFNAMAEHNQNLVRNLQAKIEELKVMTSALRLSESNMRITLQSIVDGVIATDEEGLITRMNPVAEHLTGYESKDAVGLPLDHVLQMVSGERTDSFGNAFATIKESGRVVGFGPYTKIKSRNGTIFNVSVSGALMRDDEMTVGVVVVFHDMSEHLMLEEKLRQSQKMDAIGQLAGGVAHDFNNMLGGIMGAADLVHEMVKDNKKLSSLVEMIIISSKKAAGLIQKLLSFSRKGTVQIVPIDVNKMIEEVVLILERSIDKRIKVFTNLIDGKIIVEGDVAQLESAVLNLGLNARDAMIKGGILAIETKRTYLDEAYCGMSGFSIKPGSYVVVKVSDSGIGIDKSILDRIYEPFYTTKEVGKGTGLGLTAVYSTVKDHGGMIQVESTLGEGSIFQIYLPEKSSLEDTDADEEIAKHCTNKMIFVVEDEDMLHMIAVEMIQDLDHHTISAYDGKEAVDVYRKRNKEIDLVILDVMMPHMNGADVFQEMKKINPDVKVVFVSGFSKDGNISELLDDPQVMGFLQKPYRKRDLQHMIDTSIS